MNKKYILLTGASTGIGKETAIFLAKRDYIVFAGVRSDKDFENLTNLNVNNIRPIKLDVTVEKNREEVFTFISKEIEQGDEFSLINNAGITVLGPLEGLSSKEWQRQMDVNFFSVVELIRMFLPLIRSTQGRIINVSSTAGIVAWPFASAYAASKFAIEGLSDALRIELKPFEIPVILILPGAIKTPIWSKVSGDKNFELSYEIAPYYRGRLESTLELTKSNLEKNGVPALIVSEKIYQALTSKNPKARYLAGKSAVLQYFLKRTLSTRLYDWLKFSIPEKQYKKNHDFSGEKYLIYQEMGEPVDMIFCKHTMDCNQKEWFFRSHAEGDGMSSFKKIIKLQDDIDFGEVPTVKDFPKPSLVKRLYWAYRHYRRIQGLSYNWKTFTTMKKSQGSGFGSLLFSKEETKLLLKMAKEKKTSLTAVLLWALDLAVKEICLDGCKESAWVLPVNIRENEEDVSKDKNLTSSLTIRIKESDDFTSLHHQIHDLYGRGYHWGSWIISNISKYLSRKKLKQLIRKNKTSWLGVYSNMGNLPSKNSTSILDENVRWYAGPPATSMLPVTTASMSWGLKLAFTLQLHQSIDRDGEKAKEVLSIMLFKLRSFVNDSSEIGEIHFTPWEEVEKSSTRF